MENLKKSLPEQYNIEKIIEIDNDDKKIEEETILNPKFCKSCLNCTQCLTKIQFIYTAILIHIYYVTQVTFNFIIIIKYVIYKYNINYNLHVACERYFSICNMWNHV